MIQFIKNILGLGPKVDISELIHNGAVIIDVRSQNEYKNGSVKGSINIPLDTIQSNLKKIDKTKTIITCCASGARSGMAKSILKSNGYENVHNGGGWSSLKKYVN